MSSTLSDTKQWEEKKKLSSLIGNKTLAETHQRDSLYLIYVEYVLRHNHLIEFTAKIPKLVKLDSHVISCWKTRENLILGIDW